MKDIDSKFDVNTWLISEHACGVVGGDGGPCMVFQACHAWHIPPKNTTTGKHIYTYIIFLGHVDSNLTASKTWADCWTCLGSGWRWYLTSYSLLSMPDMAHTSSKTPEVSPFFLVIKPNRMVNYSSDIGHNQLIMYQFYGVFFRSVCATDMYCWYGDKMIYLV